MYYYLSVILCGIFFVLTFFRDRDTAYRNRGTNQRLCLNFRGTVSDFLSKMEKELNYLGIVPHFLSFSDIISSMPSGMGH